MSYASGLMMGTAIIQGLRQLLGGSASFESMNSMNAMGGMRRMGARANGSMNFRWPSEQQNMPYVQQGGPLLQTLELVSSLPGRRRYRISGMNEAQAKLLEEKLVKISYVNEVKANHLSGSLLITYDEPMAAEMDKLADSLKTILTRTSSSANPGIKTPCTPPAPFPPLVSPHAGEITYSIHRAMYSFSAWLKQNTWGLFDASSLISLLFFIRGVRKLLLTQQFPSGSQLIWWAISLMRGWRIS